MKAIKRIDYKGSQAVLFANGNIMWAGMLFEGGNGANEGLLKAIKA